MIYGHKNKIVLLKNLTNKDSLSHAYLFFGPSQVGKFKIAKSLGYYLEQNKFEIVSKPLIDAKVIDAPTISIEDIRNIKSFLSKTPLNSIKRLVIVNNAENITWQAQPALLKIVEEPPERALIILITHDSQNLSPALLSRLNKIYFGALSQKKLVKILEDNYNLKPEKAQKIATASFGKIGRALNLITHQPINQEQFINGQEIPLPAEIEQKILDLYLKNLNKNAREISFLLDKLSNATRLNLNPKLQRKAIEYTLKQ